MNNMDINKETCHLHKWGWYASVVISSVMMSYLTSVLKKS